MGTITIDGITYEYDGWGIAPENRGQIVEVADALGIRADGSVWHLERRRDRSDGTCTYEYYEDRS
jgi:hypothetical protein